VVKKNVLDRFVKFGGYGIVKRKRTNGKWKNVSMAAKRTGLSRPTIYALLKHYPELPNKTLPKYVEEFRQSEGYRRVKMLYEKTLSRGEWNTTVYDIRKAWKYLNKKDPISWTEEDFRKIWNWHEFLDPLAGGFEVHHATKFHRLMRAINRHDLLSKFKSKKRQTGSKKQWFLRGEEIIRLISKIETADTLLFSYAGLVCGARASAMLHTKVQDINFEDYAIQVYEPKTKQYVAKYPPICFFILLEKYIKDFNLRLNDKLFSNSYGYYNKALREAGKRAGIMKTITTHILKHTFISQGYRHGLSRETVVEQTGTEDRTIKLYYLSLEEKKVRHEMQGIKYDSIPFYEWVQSLHPHFEQKYEWLNGTL
jgi:integrase